MLSYNEPVKKKARHIAIKKAVDGLTHHRFSSTVVKRGYVRNLYDFFINMDELCSEKNEAEQIDKKYIVEWERCYDATIGTKRPDELTVCYLCGPEPDNDFQEFINLGVLPQNIWAFENDKNCFKEAINNYKTGSYPQPRIINQDIENFFQNTPKKFDIVYIDSCSHFVSKRHSLRCVKTLFQCNCLSSVGALITNFCASDNNLSDDEYIQLIALYNYFKIPDSEIISLDGNNNILNAKYLDLVSKIKEDFINYYGEFISSVIRDLGLVFTPIQRINKNTYFKKFADDKIELKSFDYEKLFKMAKYNNLAKFVFSSFYLKKHNFLNNRLDVFFKEIGDLDELCLSFMFLIQMENGSLEYNEHILEITNYFESNDIYCFLDRVHKNMFFDIAFNQLTYPMHYNCENNWRCDYVAKTNRMFLDLTFFDSCRYIYEWLPSTHQIMNAFSNKSWQYVFRFALDGLIGKANIKM